MTEVAPEAQAPENLRPVVKGVWEYVDISALAGKPHGTLVIYAVINAPDAFGPGPDGVPTASPAGNEAWRP